MKRDRFEAFIDAVRAMRELADNNLAMDAQDIYPEWRKEGEAYSVGDRVLYHEVLYTCIQAHISQDNWNPEEAVSLWARVLIPNPNVIPEWEQPDSTNAYMTGDKVTHNGQTWESLIDNNVWEPGAVGTEALWRIVQE